ncbi:agmatine deiminase [Levilactobacillus bambusae]|uniref:Putative agmatine deiminase n=1 Tax=Levilactobacillus bambusae TaxID=2024736 RepID=A0A2V1MYJ9_9LACO|nr:agmatine deiminase [Levilactobacillus bambusae]PWF99842.1 agmatine deiminase [Levilactobacillus bambusae]
MEISASTPTKDGFYMVPEWAKHQGAYMMWPERPDNWREGGKPAQRVITEIANKLVDFEPVTMLVSRAQYEHAYQALSNQVRVVEMSYNDAWIRDMAPTFLLNQLGIRRGIDWRFNAWGGLVDGLYFPWDQDDLVAQKICALEQLDFYKLQHFVLEGCSYTTDGEGTLIVTEEVLLSEGRNGEMTKDEIEEVLKTYLNVTKIIWLQEGFFMDETNGDIDNMVSFIRPGEVALTWSDDQNDPQTRISRAAEKVLQSATDAMGRPFKIHRLTVPTPLYATAEESEGVDPVNGLLPRYPGDRLTATYVNAYLANGAVFVPTFKEPQDEQALQQYQAFYPDRQIIPIYSRELLLGGGSIHSVIAGLPE